MSSVQSAAVWAVSAGAVGGILVRPRRTPEWFWAVAGAVLAAGASAMSVPDVWRAVSRGADVYAFLIGILCLAELARAERVFDVLAVGLLRVARGSQTRLFGLLYIGGTVVTALLSNDTTIVVLTPAVLAATRRSRTPPAPYLYICAFVANAASFLLPISNPANLVLFGGALPAVGPWLHAFGAAALASVVMTYITLRVVFGRELRSPYRNDALDVERTPSSALTGALVLASAVVLVAAASFGVNVGYTALGAAAVSLAVTAVRSRRSAEAALAHTAWSVVPLVAGLFVIVTALDRSGAIDAVRALLRYSQTLGVAGTFLIGTTVTVAANLFNNLPVALASGVALQSAHVAPHITDATLVAVDLGPNLAVSGSLATLLWLIVLRREGINVTASQFLRVGTFVLLPALVAALLLVR